MDENEENRLPKSNHSLDRWLRILAWFCPPDLYEGIAGDLKEEFESDVALHGKTIAGNRLRWSVIRFFRPAIIFRNRYSPQPTNLMMLGSYFTITVRAIRKSWAYSLINIFGLAVGIASCLLIYNYVRFEQSFDKTHPDVERLYRVNQTATWTPNGGIMTSSGPQLAHALQSDYPEVEAILRINTPGDFMVRYTDPQAGLKAFRETNILGADSTFFSFFDFKLKEGDARTALIGKNKVVLSAEAAEKYFGDEPALGKILLFGEERRAVEVTGVTEPQPANIHFHFDYLISIYTNEALKRFEWSFIWSQVVTYIKVKPNTDVAALQEKIQSIAQRRVKPMFEQMNMNFDDFMRDKGGWHFYLQPVTDIRLGSANIFQRFEEVGDRAYVYIFSGVAGFILLIAAINFINLSTARATMRAKEVGVKKSLGAFRKSLIIQFQFESIFISALATIVAVILAILFRPIIFQVTGFNLPLSLVGWQTATTIIAVPLVLGFIAGIYPAFYLTAFQPIQVLKGKLASGMKSGSLRNSLVTLQFTIAIALISITLLVFQQLRFLANKNLGLDKENVLLVNHAEVLGTQLESFRNEVANFDDVINVTAAMGIPGRLGFEDAFSKEGSTESIPITQLKTDSHFFSTLGLTLVTGREFTEGGKADRTSILLNENCAKLFGWTPEEALGKYVVSPGADSKLEVIGVVKDFHFQSLHTPITPILFLTLDSPTWGDMRLVAIKYKTTDLSRLMGRIEERWKQLSPATPVELQFYDELLAQQYENEQRLGGLFAIFASFSMGVGIIGLIGLVAYSADQRKKEIGIRKVFGASIPRIFIMLNSQYVKLIAIAVVIAAPGAWWVIQQWLDSFAYHIEVNPFVFLLAAFGEISLAVLCVGYLSLKAATLSPAMVLKDE